MANVNDDDQGQNSVGAVNYMGRVDCGNNQDWVASRDCVRELGEPAGDEEHAYLRDYQRAAALYAVDAFHETIGDPDPEAKLCVQVGLPTGAGKTRIMLALGKALTKQKGQKVLVVAPNVLIRKNIFASAKQIPGSDDTTCVACASDPEEGEVSLKLRTGFEKARHAKIIVGNIQGLSKVTAELKDLGGDMGAYTPPFRCIIVDEGHHNAASMYQEILRKLEPKLVLVISATLLRRDELTLVPLEYGDRTIFARDLRWAEENNYVRKTRVMKYGFDVQLRISSTVDDGEVIKVTPKMILDGQAAQDTRIPTGKLVQMIVNSYQGMRAMVRRTWQVVKARRAKNKSKELFVAFCANTEQAIQVAAMFQAFQHENVKVEALFSKLSRQDQNKICKDFKNGRLDGLVCCDMLGEGFDEPLISVISFFTAMKTHNVTFQKVGVDYGLSGAPERMSKVGTSRGNSRTT